MKKTIGFGVLVGAMLTAPLIALLYLADQLFNWPFPPFDLFNWLVRVLPGPLITFGIDLMIDTMLFLGVDVAVAAKSAERAMAVLMFFTAGVVLAALIFVLLRLLRARGGWLSGLLAGIIFGLPAIALSGVFNGEAAALSLPTGWLAVLFLAWGLLLAFSYRRLFPAPVQPVVDQQVEVQPGAEPLPEASVTGLNRRQFLITLGAGAATITVAGAGVGSFLASSARRRSAAELEKLAGVGPGITFPNSGDVVMPAPGTRPEYTPIPDHYKVFLDTEPSFVEPEGYTLPIMGLVDNPLELTLDQIYNQYESFDQFVTLSCISGRVGTTLISTTMWTGISMQDILADVGAQPQARYLHVMSEDGFHESVPLEMIAADRRIMLCHSWNGSPLPQDHGFPLRIWLPDRFGMKQPKWIIAMEISDEEKPGYWVKRGWDEIAQVKTTAVVDTVAVDTLVESGTRLAIPVGGIAWAGDRQVSKVEVRVDNGPWMEAQLRQPLSETTWVIWRFDWPFEEGEHDFEVRTYEADGTPQIEEVNEARPSGSTGYHHKDADV